MAEQTTENRTPNLPQAPTHTPGPNGNGNGTGNAPGPGGSTGAPAGPPSAGGADKPAGSSPARKAVIGLIVAAVVIGGGAYGAHQISFGRTHVSTDDAFITGNLINVSPLISGTLMELDVAEGDTIKRGTLLAKLDDATEQASLRQAQAAYTAANSQILQARSSLAYEDASSKAAIQKAQAALATQAARTTGAQAQVALTSRTTESQVQQAQSNVQAERATAQQVAAQAKSAQANVISFRQAIQTADRGVRSLQAKVAAAQADVDKYSRDEARYKKLLEQEAVTQQQYDVVAAQLTSAQSALSSLQEQIGQAKSQAEQARANVSQAEAQLAAAQDATKAAQEKVRVAIAALNVAQAGRTQVGVQNANLSATRTQDPQAQADLAAAQAGRTQVTLRRQQIETAQATATQSQAAVRNAEVQLERTKIYSPSDGTVVRKSVNIGASVAPGQTLFTMTQGGGVYITANFKETQIGNVRVGQAVEIDVDAFPGRRFKGIVGAINEATGASTSLLPPDNATGNFTKVVQRIPVKIAIVAGTGKDEASAQDIELLRQGMSVLVTIDTADTTPHPDRVPADYDRAKSVASK